MKKRIYVLILGSLLLVSCKAGQNVHSDQVCFGKTCVDVEVVSTPEAMRKGLQGRVAMADNQGMLFTFPRAERHSFWMKDTLIPLDMIWMDHERRIVDLHLHVPPCKADPCETYGPSGENALYVLEVNAGYCQKKGLKRGNQAEFRLR